MSLFTCKGKGGEYRLIGNATGAGKSAGSVVIVYQDTTTDRLFFRDGVDFDNRMEKIDE